MPELTLRGRVGRPQRLRHPMDDDFREIRPRTEEVHTAV
jgi:hypothetical protein